MTKIAIALDDANPTFAPPNAIIGEQTPDPRGGINVKILWAPDGLPGSGDWLERDSFGTWQRRTSPGGSDAQFALSGSQLVSDHWGTTHGPFFSFVQSWSA